MASGQTSNSTSRTEYFPGQRGIYTDIFGMNGRGGIWDQFLKGKPNAGFERAQAQGLEQLKRGQAQAGMLNTPLGTRQQSDFLQRSTSAGGDNWLQEMFAFMKPSGVKSVSRSAGGGVL